MRAPLFIMILLLPLHALAADPQPSADGRNRGRELFGQANKAYKKGQYDEALKLYRQANAILPSYKIQLNIGEALESMGRNTEAAAEYHGFLSTFKDAPRPARRDAWLRLDGMRRWLSQVEVTCAEKGAVVSIEGNEVGKTPLALPLYVQPGEHTVTIKKDGFKTVSRTLRGRRGGRQTLIVELEEDRPVERPKAATAQACPKVTCPPCHDDALRRSHRRMTTGGYVALGTGLTLVTSAAVLYGVGGARGAAAYDLYNGTQNPAAMARHYDDVQDARALLTAGHAFMGAGLVAVGLSIYQFLARPELPAETVVGMAPLGGGAALSVGGRF